MNLSFVRKHRFALMVGVAAVAMIVVAGLSDAVVASNMGFKMNRQILVGNNLVSLPYKTPIAKALDVCDAFGKFTRRPRPRRSPSSTRATAPPRPSLQPVRRPAFATMPATGFGSW